MITRFRPTPSGDLHCGHAWVALHNWEIAHHCGDPFVLIGDDLTYNFQYLETGNFSFALGMQRIAEDLAWLGMKPDEIVWSSMNAEAHAAAAETLGLKPMSRNQRRDADLGTHVIASPGSTSAVLPVDAYSPWLTMCRVVDDHLAGVQGFFRGADLVGERQLYDDLARRLRYVPPAQGYLPLLYREAEVNGRKESKSFGAVNIRQLRAAGYEPHQIIQTLRWCAEVSTRDRREGVMVPPGYLETEAVRWHHHNINEVRFAAAPEWTPPPVVEPERYPSDDWVEEHKRIMRERLGRGQ